MSQNLTNNITYSIDNENLSTWKTARNNPSLALKAAKKNLILAKENNYSLGIAWATGNIGTAHLWLSNYEEALEYTSQARELLHQEKDFEHEADILYNLCVIFYYLGVILLDLKE